MAVRIKWVEADELAEKISDYLQNVKTHSDWLQALMHGPVPLHREFGFDVKRWEQ